MSLEYLREDAEDILKLYEQTKENPLHFPGEKFLEVKRNTSHRRWIQKHPVKNNRRKLRLKYP